MEQTRCQLCIRCTIRWDTLGKKKTCEFVVVVSLLLEFNHELGLIFSFFFFYLCGWEDGDGFFGEKGEGR